MLKTNRYEQRHKFSLKGSTFHLLAVNIHFSRQINRNNFITNNFLCNSALSKFKLLQKVVKHNKGWG